LRFRVGGEAGQKNAAFYAISQNYSLPRSGCITVPRVAAAATLGTMAREIQPQRGYVPGRNPFRVV